VPARHRGDRYLDAHLIHDRELGDRVQVLAILLREAHHDVVLVLAVPELGGLGAVDGAAHGAADVCGAQVIEGRLLAIDLDREFWPCCVEIALEPIQLLVDRRLFEDRDHLVRESLENPGVLAGDLDVDRGSGRRSILRLLDPDVRSRDTGADGVSHPLQDVEDIVLPILEVEEVDRDRGQMGPGVLAETVGDSRSGRGDHGLEILAPFEVCQMILDA
jgi:hypothetical protein